MTDLHPGQTLPAGFVCVAAVEGRYLAEAVYGSGRKVEVASNSALGLLAAIDSFVAEAARRKDHGGYPAELFAAGPAAASTVEEKSEPAPAQEGVVAA